jgi:GH15 family glucan-1,4-alpha-glucosidase
MEWLAREVRNMSKMPVPSMDTSQSKGSTPQFPRDSDFVSYGLIGNMRTAALISSEDCSIDHLCWPDFDSPSIFIRLLDKHKGGHFEASPSNETTAKQSYSGNILVTKFLSEMGVSHVTDFMPLPDPKSKNAPFYPWLIRRLECVRGEVVFKVECFPAFNYARSKHTARLIDDENGKRVLFESPDSGLNFELLWTVDDVDEAPRPKIDFRSYLYRW